MNVKLKNETLALLDMVKREYGWDPLENPADFIHELVADWFEAYRKAVVPAVQEVPDDPVEQLTRRSQHSLETTAAVLQSANQDRKDEPN